MKNFPFFNQLDKMDCGPTCLRMIAKYYGKNISQETLRKHSYVNRSGVSLYALGQAAETLGFKSMACKISFDQLIDITPLPCVVHWNQNHFVVITPLSNSNKIQIADPSRGVSKVSKIEFLKSWTSFHDNGIDKGIVLILEPTTKLLESENEPEKGIDWGMLTGQLFKYKSLISQLFIGLSLGSLLQLIFPFLTQSIVDNGINSQNLSFIQLILFAQLVLFFSQTLIEFIRGKIILYIGSRVNFSLLSSFWMKLMQLPINYFESKQISDIFQRLTDHKRLDTFISSTALQTIFSIFNLILFSIILSFYNINLFAIFFASSLAYIFWIRLFFNSRKRLDYKSFALSARDTAMTMQLLYGMQEIKLNNAEHGKRWKWEGLQAEVFKLGLKSLTLSHYQFTGAFFINQGKNIVITYLTAKSVLNGELTFGAMLSIQYIVGQMNSPVEQIVQFIQQMQDAKNSMERLNDIHKAENERVDSNQIAQLSSADIGVEIKNLTFAYPGNKPVLKNINLLIPSGKLTAIVGVSGSGKTTLLKLLQKIYTEYDGEIKVNSTDLQNINPHFWRSICGSVMQDAFIFSDTIENNIIIGDDSPNYKKMIQACTMANVLSFIESLPLGFDTKIGSEGNGISQGQRQRILIARAIYKGPRLVFLDEATNSLDANNEKIILNNLSNFFQGKTVVVVAHRLSTVKNADNIIVLDEGEITEHGSHLELTNLKGKYFELVKNQLELGN